MIRSLKEANKNIEQAEKYYYKYILEAKEKCGNQKLCSMIGRSEIYIFKTLKHGSISAKRRLANVIELAISDGTDAVKERVD
jgi:hypothetical protein